MFRTIVVSLACAMLVATGVVHGVWTDRWSAQTDLHEAAEGLARLPTTIGGWQGRDIEMERDPKAGLAGVIARRYVHTKDNKIVTILLGCGRSGPVCTHTPDVCYEGNGYKVEKPIRFRMPVPAGQSAPEFWTSRFVRERASGRTHLRIFWAWHGADTWKIADNPRLSFAGEPMLYKLYVVREMAQADEPLESEACVEFMQELLPAFRQSVLGEKKS